MRVNIVFNHPYEGSYCHAILDSVKRGLDKAGHEIDVYKLTYGDAIKRALIRGTLKKSGIKNVKWLSLNMVKASSSEKRGKWLEKIEKRFTGLK